MNYKVEITLFIFVIFLFMKSGNLRAFTFVELIITLSILALLSVIWYTAVGNKQQNTLNTKVTSEVETLKNALLLAKQENSVLPLPDGNNNFYAIDTSYSHDYENENTYWVHGFITQNTLAKKYIDVIPVDPRTNSYYAYGKTKWSEMYEIASVIFENQEPKSRVIWDYTAMQWPFNLIREYNGPYFVDDNSTQNFAYNPYEKILSAKIWDNSGNITVNGKNLTADGISNIHLVSGDTIEVPQNNNVTLYFSDGTVSALWDTSQVTKLTLQNLEFPKQNNLITKVQLVLQSGMIWNKAASLDEESQFEIYTIDSTAAVRGTVFWVQKNLWNSKILVSEWKVAVYKNYENNLETILEKISNNEVISKEPVSWNNITINTQTWESLIEVETDESIKWVEINSNTQWEVGNNTDAIENIWEESKKDIFENRVKFSSQTTFEVNEFSMNSSKMLEKFVLKIHKNVWNSTDFITFNDQNNNELLTLETHEIWESQISWENDIFYIDITNNLYLILSNDVIVTNAWRSQTGQYQNGTNQSLRPDTTSITSPVDINKLYIYLSQNRYSVQYNSKIISLPIIVNSNISQEEPQGELPLLVREKPILPPLDEDESEDDDECSKTFWADNQYCWEKTSWLNISTEFELAYYAPYDVAGDIHMYSDNDTYVNLSQKSITDNFLELPDYCKNWSDEWNSFCIQEDGTKGIFIDSTDNDDYIKYSWLGIHDDFIIEMNIKGDALKENKNWKNHNIITIEDKNISILNLSQGNKLNIWDSSCFDECNFSSINWDQNYTVLISNNNFSIYNDNYEQIINFNWFNISSYIGFVYIWTNKFKNNQINSIINYVKIYEK